MRTLYFRIVFIFMLISFASMVLALLLTNIYYAENVREYNEQKIINIGEEIQTLYKKTNDLELGEYLTHIGNIGFQIYVVDNELNGTFYGTPFRHQEIDSQYVREVLNGGIYNGIMEESHLLAVFSLFESSIQNSIGLPLTVKDKPYAMFIRPNLEQQFGEVRIIVAVLFGLIFVLSILFIIIATRYIVKPVKNLTAATNKIVNGDYNIKMDISRRDELGNLARHFTQMASSIKQLDEMRQEFVANVSHEFQSPLTSIQGFSQAILDKKTTPEEEERYLQIIEKESRRLSVLSKQLLTLAALDKEETVMNFTTFRLDEQIRQVLIATEWQWTEKQLLLEPELPEVTVKADAGLLYQVWHNLITNSIKFSRNGDTIRIRISVDQSITVTISDTGIGIPEDELLHIFDRFHKVDAARSRTNAGSGLGLSIVKKVIDMHSGTIDIKSRLGEGTTVIVRLSLISSVINKNNSSLT